MHFLPKSYPQLRYSKKADPFCFQRGSACFLRGYLTAPLLSHSKYLERRSFVNEALFSAGKCWLKIPSLVLSVAKTTSITYPLQRTGTRDLAGQLWLRTLCSWAPWLMLSAVLGPFGMVSTHDNFLLQVAEKGRTAQYRLQSLLVFLCKLDWRYFDALRQGKLTLAHPFWGGTLAKSSRKEELL